MSNPDFYGSAWIYGTLESIGSLKERGIKPPYTPEQIANEVEKPFGYTGPSSILNPEVEWLGAVKSALLALSNQGIVKLVGGDATKWKVYPLWV